MIVKKVKKFSRINVPAVIALVGVLIVTLGCTPNKLLEADTQVGKTQDVALPSEAEETVMATSIPPGYSSEVIQVKFRKGTDIDPPELARPPELRTSVANISQLFSPSAEELGEIGAGELRLWFRIILKPGTDAPTFIEQLKSLDSVEIVEPAPLPAPPP
jgi:hypothetical protein